MGVHALILEYANARVKSCQKLYAIETALHNGVGRAQAVATCAVGSLGMMLDRIVPICRYLWESGSVRGPVLSDAVVRLYPKLTARKWI